MNFSDQQLAVINSDEKRLAVLAVAGSGKSATMVGKVKKFIDDGIPARNIAVITFTKDAAESIEKRLEKLNCDTNGLTTKTLHSFCYNLIKMCYNFTGRHELPKILSSPDIFIGHFWKLTGVYKGVPHKSWQLYYQAIYHYQLTQELPEDVIRKIYNKNPDQFRKDFLEGKYDGHREGNREAWNILFYLEYESWKKLSSRMDFNDMILLAIRELKRAPESALGFIRNKYKVIIIDESQDTNSMVVDVLKLIVAPETYLIMVGDLRQSIYSFTNASPKVILDYMKYESFKHLSLNTNYRSHADIIESSNQFISHYPSVNIGGDAIPHLPSNGFPVVSMVSIDETNELDSVIELIDRLKNQDEYEYKDIAILYRTNAQAMLVIDYCVSSGIPFNIKKDSSSIFDRNEMKDILAYLKIFNETDKTKLEDFKRILNKPTRYASNKALEGASSKKAGIVGFGTDLLNNYQSDSKIHEFVQQINYHIRVARQMPLDAQISYIMDTIGYEAWWEKSDEKDKFFDLRIYTNALAKLTEKHKTYRDLIKHINEVRKALQEDNSEDGISFYTIHGSKGLEFPVCILMGVCSRLYPFHRAVSENGRDGYEEEARLFYVASTRPIERMYYSEIRGKYGRFKVEQSIFTQQAIVQTFNGSMIGE